MFKFNFNVDENNSNENSDQNEEDNPLTNQEFGYLTIDELQSSVRMLI